MQFLDVLATLNDLPDTFKRPGAWYTQLMDSLAASLSLYTLGEDAAMNQIASFTNAAGGWLDVWGLLFGFARLAGEPDVTYKARIQNTILARVGTVPAIQYWLSLYIPGGTVIENSGTPGYVLSVPGAFTLAQIQAFLVSFNRIRPVGVPFSISQAGLGLYLGTDEWTGDGRVTGNYLTSLSTPVGLTLGASTPNSVPLLPNLLLVDPTLNP
jgi:hypothetical protein